MAIKRYLDIDHWCSQRSLECWYIRLKQSRCLSYSVVCAEATSASSDLLELRQAQIPDNISVKLFDRLKDDTTNVPRVE